MGIPANAVMLASIYGLTSAAGYTLANIYLRSLIDSHPAWVSCVKAIPTLMLVTPWLWIRYQRGHRQLPDRGAITLLTATGLFGHLCGNVVFQWALGIVGLVLAVPLTLGTMIVTGAFLGYRFLQEELTRPMLLSIALLVSAVFLLSLGAGDANQSIQSTAEPEAAIRPVSPWVLAAGVGAACLAGVAYSLLGAAIRHGQKKQVSLPMTLGIVSLVGLVSLGFLSLIDPGLSVIRQTTLPEYQFMFYAGIWNAIAFLALVKALQQTSLIHVNALSATQVGMTVLAGILLFGEALTWMATCGVGLTILGLLLMRGKHSKDDTKTNGSSIKSTGASSRANINP